MGYPRCMCGAPRTAACAMRLAVAPVRRTESCARSLFLFWGADRELRGVGRRAWLLLGSEPAIACRIACTRTRESQLGPTERDEREIRDEKS